MAIAVTVCQGGKGTGDMMFSGEGILETVEGRTFRTCHFCPAGIDCS